MAAGVGKTYRMLQEGRQAQHEGHDVVIGYLEPHDRPETAALADGLETVPRLHARTAGSSSTRWTLDAVIARAPELALVDELAHTNAPGVAEREALRGHRRDPRRRHRRHLDGQRPAPREPQRRGLRAHRRPRPRDVPGPDPRRGRRGRARRPDARGAAGPARAPARSTRRERAEVALQNFFRLDNLAALRELVLRELAEDVEARRHDRRSSTRSASTRSPSGSSRWSTPRAEVAADPPPRLAFGAAARLGDRRALGAAARPRARASEEATQLAALRRLASILGVALHRGGGRRSRRDRQAASPTSAARPTSSSARPTSRGAREILRGSLALEAGPGAARHRHPRRRRPRAARGAAASRRDRSRRRRGAARVGAVCADGASAAKRVGGPRALHRRRARPGRARRGDPDRARRGGDARARLPDRRAARVSTPSAADAAAGRASRCRSSRRSSTPRCAPAFRSTRASRAAARRSTRCSGSGTSSASTASSSRRRPGGPGVHAEGSGVDAHARSERDADPPSQS